MIATADWEAWSCRVRLAVSDPAALDEARHVLTDRLAAVDDAASRFRSDSEVARLDEAAGAWTPVTSLLTELLTVALRAARLTDGDVDPTVGAALCGLGYDRDFARIDPTGTVVTAAVPGWQTIELDAAAQRVRMAPGVRLDLGATAKAWTADSAAAEITRRTGTGCLVSIGGDIAVAGPAPDGGWGVRVEDVTGNPDRPASGPHAVVRISDGGLATSSTQARRWQRGGLDLHHLVDPRSGMPPAPAWRTVSAAAGRCVDANIVTTATIVRGRAAWPWLRQVGVPVRLVTVDGEVLTVGGWPQEAAAA